MTKKSREFEQEEIQRTEAEEQDYKNINEIIQNLIEIEESFKDL